MGGLFSRRVGSDPYYADYERVFTRLRSETDRLQKRRSDRKHTLEAVGTAIFRYGSVGFVLSVVLAAWVQQQPDGTFTTREHSLLVLPLFLEPALAYLLYEICHHALEWRDAKDLARLKMLEGKLRKMVTELKDSTRYAKTHKLLEKYDPDYCPPTPRPPPPGPAARSPGSARPAPPGSAAGPLAVPGSTVRRGGASSILLPALDKLAATVVGDNPSLMEALRATEAEAAALKARLANAEQWARYLARENAQLKAQLGQGPALLLEGPEPARQLFREATPSSIEEPGSPGPSSSARRSAELQSARGAGTSPRLESQRSLTEGAEPTGMSSICEDGPHIPADAPEAEPLTECPTLPALRTRADGGATAEAPEQERCPAESRAAVDKVQEGNLHVSQPAGTDEEAMAQCSEEKHSAGGSGPDTGAGGAGFSGGGGGVAGNEGGEGNEERAESGDSEDGFLLVPPGKGVGDVISHAILVDSSAPSTPQHHAGDVLGTTGLHRRPAAFAG